MKRTIHITVVFLLIASMVLSACDTFAPEEEQAALKIALIAPFDVKYSALGQSAQNGAVLAAETWNARGGVLGLPVQLVLLDSACDYQTARAAAQQAISTDGVQFIVGAICANASEGVAQVASEAGVLQITPASVNLDLTLDIYEDLRPLVFRVPFVDPDQGTVAAKLALTTLEAETAAMLYDEDSVYGATLANAFATEFQAGGGEIVEIEVYSRVDLDYTRILTKTQLAEPEVIYAPGYPNVINPLIAEARLYGMRQPFIGSDGWDSPELDLAVTDGAYFTTHFFLGDPRIAVQSWISRYEARYIVKPDTLATLTYDAMNILFEAIEEAESLFPANVALAMEGLRFETVGGDMRFDEAHNPVKAVTILQINNNAVQIQGRLYPVDPEDE